MLLHYKAQIYCMFILTIVLFICVVGIKNREKENKLFNWLLVSALVNMCFDIGSNYTVNHLKEVPAIVNRVVHIFFFVSMITIFFIVYEYVVAIIEKELGRKLKWMLLSTMPYVVVFVLTFFLPIYYVEEKNGNWSYGPGPDLVYICAGIYVALIFILIVRYRNKISRKNKMAIILAITCELGAAIFQMLIPAALTSSLGVILLCLCLYITVANPDAILVELLKEQTARADAANKAKSDFLARMSHEIRTPINAVLGMNEMIIRESKEPEIRKYSSDIKSSANGLLSIVNEILDSSKIESGKIEISEARYEISNLLNDLYNMFDIKAKEKGLKLIFDIDSDIPSEYFGDDVRIRQILINILNNAVKYTPKGTVTFRLTGRREEEKEILRFSVIDTGIGIKEENIDKLFSKFERIEEQSNRYVEGTGLGINIVIQLLRLMGSELKVKSEYERGSEFYFDIVQQIMTEEKLGDFKDRIESSVDNNYKVKFIAPDAKILVVDDNEINIKVFKNLVKKMQFEVVEAYSGLECIDKIEKDKFNVVFLDYMMPEMDGIETLRKLKEKGLCDNLPIIMLTANAVKGAKKQCLSEGFDDFISKPIIPEKLDELLYKYIPKNLIKNIEEEEERQEVKRTDLPELEEFDFEYAMKLLTDKEMLMSSLEDFYYMLKKLPDKLNGYVYNITDDEMLKLYRVEVHAIKSVSATVGAILLSKLARMLEVAAINKEIDKIHNLHPILLEEMEKHIKRVEEILPKKEEKLEPFNSEMFKIHLQMLQNALEEYDYDRADLIGEEISKYMYPQQFQPLVEELKEFVRSYMVDESLEVIEKIRQI